MKQILIYTGITLLAIWIVYMSTQLMDSPGPGGGPLVPESSRNYLALLLPLIVLFVAVVHELGHLLAGYGQNFDFYELNFGPLVWRQQSNGRIGFRWEKRFNFETLMLPNGKDNMRSRFIWHTAGGPLASLMLAIIFFLLAQLFSWAFLCLIAYMVCLTSTGLFLITILPFRFNGIDSDGMCILKFASKDAAAAGDITRMRALAHVRSGKPYAEFPEAELIAVATNEETNDWLRVHMDYFRYLFRIGVGDVAQAKKLLDSILDRLHVYPVTAHGNFYLDQALFSAKFLKDLPAAEAALKKVQKSHKTDTLSIHLAEAAIAELKGDTVALALELSGIEMNLPWSVDQSRVPIVQKWLSEWKEMVRTTSW